MFDISQLKNIRRKLNLTQNKFAKKAGVSQSLIAKIESNKIDPTFSKVKKIEEALNRISKDNEKEAKDIMITELISINPKTQVSEIIELLNKHAISQLPVVEDNNIKGVIYESNLLEQSTKDNFSSFKAEDIMVEAPPIVSEETKVSVISSLLKFYPMVLVSKGGSTIGLITKADLLKNLL